MRILVVNKTDTDLSQQLLRRPGAASATLERIVALNPHVKNFERLAAGTVLVLPEAPDLKAGAGIAAGSEELGAVLDDVKAGLKAATERARAGFTRLESGHADIAAALKSAASKRILESDPALKQQLQTAVAQLKTDEKRAADALQQFAEAQKLAQAEFAQLAKMLGQ